MRRFFLLLVWCGWVTTLAAAEVAAETPPPRLLNEASEEELLAALGSLGPTAVGFSDTTNFGPDDDELIDPNVLRDFIESKGLIECRKKTGLLTIAGDVRARWIAEGEEVGGEKQRGSGSKKGNEGTMIGINRFKSEVNLFLDYVAPRSWVSTKLRWSNFDGRDGGTATRTDLDRAFIGYDIRKEGKKDFYVEIGRSKLEYIFDSRVEFTSLFDGIHIYYTRCLPTIGTWIVHGGPFVVDSTTNHYAWIAETGIIGLAGTGLGLKYSIVDWHHNSRTYNYGKSTSDKDRRLISENPRYAFIVSQMLFGYERKIDFLGCKTLYVYGAVLANHDAKRTPTTRWKKLNGAWYAGFTLGKLCKGCDWSLDINYQSVQAQAIPEFDLAGIGHGNAGGNFLSDAIINNLPPSAALGFTNYKGWSVSALYAMTDNLSLRGQAQYSVPRNKDIGKDFHYKSFEMSVIYAF